MHQEFCYIDKKNAAPAPVWGAMTERGFTIRVPAALRARLDERVARDGTTLNRAVADAIATWLAASDGLPNARDGSAVREIPTGLGDANAALVLSRILQRLTGIESILAILGEQIGDIETVLDDVVAEVGRRTELEPAARGGQSRGNG